MSNDNVSYILISEWVNGAPQVKFQFPNAQIHSTHENIAPLMLPFGCELRPEDSFMFVLHAKNQNRDSLPDSESTVLKLRKFDSKTQVALLADAFSFDGRVWKPLSSSSSLIQLAPNSATIWDSDCLRTFAEINLESKAEYRQPERDCVVVYSEASIFGLRFNSEDDEICFVNHLDSALKLGKNYSANRPALPTIPRDPFAHLPSLFCQTVVRNTNSKIRSLTIASPHSWISAFEPLVTLALYDFMMNEKIGIVTSLFQAINSLDLSTMPRLTYPERTIMRCSYEPAEYFQSTFEDAIERGVARGGKRVGMLTEEWDGTTFPANLRFMDTMHSVEIPVYLYPGELSDFSMVQLVTTFSALDSINPPQNQELKWRNSAPYYWHPHLDSGARTHPLIFLMNALLTDKRIVFVGCGRSANEISNYVFAASSFGSGGGLVLSSLLDRTFGIVGAKEIQDLQPLMTGFVAGTADESIEQRHELWDIMLDINSGKITVSPQIRMGADGMSNPRAPEGDVDWMKQGFWIGDSEFVLDVITAIQSEAPELQIRQIMYDQIQRFVDITAVFEVEILNTTLIGQPPVSTLYPGVESAAFFRDEISKNAELLMLRNRIEGFKLSSKYFQYVQNHNIRLQKTYIPSDFPIRSLMSELHNRNIHYQPDTTRLVQIMFLIQDTILPGSDPVQTELLAALRTKGISVFAAGMMHDRWEIRNACTRILWRLDWHKIGTVYIQLLNPFYRLCYSRTSHLLLNQSDDIESDDESEETDSVASTPKLSVPLVKNRQSKIRMSVLLDQRNSNRVMFNKVNSGYMRGSVLATQGLAGIMSVPGLKPTGIDSGRFQKSQLSDTTPGWMDSSNGQSPVLDNASMRSGRSGRSAASKPADMGDLDRMLKSVEKLGFNNAAYPPSSLSQPALSSDGRGKPTVYDASDDEDSVSMDRGRGVTPAVQRSASTDSGFGNGSQPPRGQSVAPNTGGERMGRSDTFGASRAPRSASTGAPGMPSYGRPTGPPAVQQGYPAGYPNSPAGQQAGLIGQRQPSTSNTSPAVFVAPPRNPSAGRVTRPAMGGQGQGEMQQQR
ncbi:hypothetical protein HDU80_005979 [Chytriomyces hyalinus]|nr:hypothetical protein HDU80_005979 [Chytriomyces hyalinus]